jgi:hypothetical protein
MRAIARRLRRLEERFGPPVETWETRRLRARLDAARLRCGLLPISPERPAKLRGMTIPEILNSSRKLAARQRCANETLERPPVSLTQPCRISESPALPKRSVIF